METSPLNLKDKKCLPCSGGVPPLNPEEKARLKPQISPQWSLTHNSTRLYRDFGFKNFAQALLFANKVGDLAEGQWHHPELHIGFGHAGVEIWTHKIDNLVESDFIFAAKVDEIFEGLQP